MNWTASISRLCNLIFFQAEDGIRDYKVTGVQTCALPISSGQKHPGGMVACLVAGYLAVWSLFGWMALGFDGGVHQTVDAITWLSDRPWLVGARSEERRGGEEGRSRWSPDH